MCRAHMAGNDRIALIDADALLAAKKPLDKLVAEYKLTSESPDMLGQFDFLEPCRSFAPTSCDGLARIDSR